MGSGFVSKASLKITPELARIFLQAGKHNEFLTEIRTNKNIFARFRNNRENNSQNFFSSSFLIID